MLQITPEELRQQLSTGSAPMLIDVREEWEREEFSIGGLHIPMGELPSRINEIPREEDIVLYCEKGIRSVIAIQRLESMGYSRLGNLMGGMKAWKAMLTA